MTDYTSNEITQAAFAALRGVSEPMVSRWKSRGRLVMSADGARVCVAESIALLDRTLDPARGGDRTGKAAPAAFEPPMSAASRQSGGRYHDAAADEKSERAAILRLERMELEGKLVFRDQVEREAQTRATQARDALLAMVDRLVPLLAAESDVDKVRAMLEADVRHVMAQLASRAPVPQMVAA